MRQTLDKPKLELNDTQCARLPIDKTKYSLQSVAKLGVSPAGIDKKRVSGKVIPYLTIRNPTYPNLPVWWAIARHRPHDTFTHPPK